MNTIDAKLIFSEIIVLLQRSVSRKLSQTVIFPICFLLLQIPLSLITIIVNDINTKS